MTRRNDLIEVLREARSLVSRPENDFSWSSWRDAAHALQEIDDLTERAESGAVPADRVALVFAPTGPLQELAEASGWGDEFLALADRLDAALEAASVVRAAFACLVCGEEAGMLELRGRAGRAELRRESFTSILTQPVQGEAESGLRTALAAGDAAALHALDPEYAPFYCPECAASYCAAHWDRRDVFDDDLPEWHDSIRGRCPRGHERMLED